MFVQNKVLGIAPKTYLHVLNTYKMFYTGFAPAYKTFVADSKCKVLPATITFIHFNTINF